MFGHRLLNKYFKFEFEKRSTVDSREISDCFSVVSLDYNHWNEARDNRKISCNNVLIALIMRLRKIFPLPGDLDIFFERLKRSRLDRERPTIIN